MDWDTVVTALGSIGIGAGAATYLAKKLLGQMLDRDIERFKSELKSDSEKEIESLKSNLQLEAQKQMVEFSSLHQRGITVTVY